MSKMSKRCIFKTEIVNGNLEAHLSERHDIFHYLILNRFKNTFIYIKAKPVGRNSVLVKNFLDLSNKIFLCEALDRNLNDYRVQVGLTFLAALNRFAGFFNLPKIKLNDLV